MCIQTAQPRQQLSPAYKLPLCTRLLRFCTRYQRDTRGRAVRCCAQHPRGSTRSSSPTDGYFYRERSAEAHNVICNSPQAQAGWHPTFPTVDSQHGDESTWQRQQQHHQAQQDHHHQQECHDTIPLQVDCSGELERADSSSSLSVLLSMNSNSATSHNGTGKPSSRLSGYISALIAAAFMVGLGAGVYLDAEMNWAPSQVASLDLLEGSIPNAELCMAYGFSAIAIDQRVFVTHNPFKLYVTQPMVQQGCILQQSNYSIIERHHLITQQQVESCKQHMNTFGFVGSLAAEPQVSCVYLSEAGQDAA